MDKRLRTDLITAIEKVLTVTVPCVAISFCVWAVMSHVGDFAGKTSILKVNMALTLGLGIATGTGGVGYGVYQRNLRRQAKKQHEAEVETLKSLIIGPDNKRTKGASR